MPAVLGQQRCPNCGERFRALKPPAGARRDCKCGKRWTLTFELVEGALAERLGQSAYRLKVDPYVDGRRRAAEGGQRLFDEELKVAPDVEQAPPKRARRLAVKRGTHFPSARRR